MRDRHSGESGETGGGGKLTVERRCEANTGQALGREGSVGAYPLGES